MMRTNRRSRISTKLALFAVTLFSVLLLLANVFAQETTGQDCKAPSKIPAAR